MDNLESDSTELKKRLDGVDENLRKLNPLTEENVKAIEKLNDNVKDNTENISRNKDRLDEHGYALNVINNDLTRKCEYARKSNHKRKEKKLRQHFSKPPSIYAHLFSIIKIPFLYTCDFKRNY